MKILISAYACVPAKTSEPGLAWRAVNHALADGHEVWSISEKEFEPYTLDYLASHPMPNYHPVFLSLSTVVKKLLKHRGIIGPAHYHLWQHRLLKVAGDLHQEVGFDLAHHVTFGRYWSPSGVRKLGIPFIWGPVGAAESAPASFLAELPPKARFFEFVRDSVRSISRLDPALKQTAKAATLALGITRESCEALRNLGAARVEQLTQIALADDELEFFDSVPPPPLGPFRAICMARLIHWKGSYLAIRAFAALAKVDPEAELWIVGEGPYKSKLIQIATETGCVSRVRFFGLLRHEQAMEKLAQAHVMMHPALHEAFGNVCLEGLAAGRPLVCLDIGGPASQVTPETGIAAPVTSPAVAVKAMGDFLIKVAGDRQLLAEMSVKARQRVHEHYTMRKMGAAMSEYYRQVTAGR